MILLQQSLQRSISFVLIIDLSLQFILIISFLVIASNRHASQVSTIKAGKIAFGLYIVFLVIDALIYTIAILQGSIPYIPMAGKTPVLFFILFSPPVPLMYLDLQLPESSGIYTALSDWSLVLFAWLVLMVILLGGIPLTITY